MLCTHKPMGNKHHYDITFRNLIKNVIVKSRSVCENKCFELVLMEFNYTIIRTGKRASSSTNIQAHGQIFHQSSQKSNTIRSYRGYMPSIPSAYKRVAFLEFCKLSALTHTHTHSSFLLIFYCKNFVILYDMELKCGCAS